MQSFSNAGLLDSDHGSPFHHQKISNQSSDRTLKSTRCQLGGSFEPKIKSVSKEMQKWCWVWRKDLKMFWKNAEWWRSCCKVSIQLNAIICLRCLTKVIINLSTRLWGETRGVDNVQIIHVSNRNECVSTWETNDCKNIWFCRQSECVAYTIHYPIHCTYVRNCQQDFFSIHEEIPSYVSMSIIIIIII